AGRARGDRDAARARRRGGGRDGGRGRRRARARDRRDRGRRTVKRRTRARELALQFLYQLDLRGDDLLTEARQYVTSEERDAETTRFALRLVQGAFENKAEIDK